MDELPIVRALAVAVLTRARLPVVSPAVKLMVVVPVAGRWRVGR